MSTLAVILIVLAALVLLVLLGGFAGARRRARLGEPDYARHVAAADAALETARAADRGWDRAVMEEAARDAVARERSGFPVEDLHLVLVDDRPGVTEDRAHFVALGPEGQVRVVLTRREPEGWAPEEIV